MKLRVRLASTGVALASLVTVACTSMSSATDVPSLDRTAWVLSWLPGRTLVEGTTATLQLEAGRASGTDGCNRFAGSYTASAGKLTFAPSAATTMMACAPAVMDQARAFAASLGATNAYRIDGGQLQLVGADGKVVAKFTPQSQELAGTAWRVSGYNNGQQAVVSVLTGTQLSMAFASDGHVSGSAGCNSFTGSYTASGTALKIGPTATTRKMCSQPAGVMEQEQRFLNALAMVASARREGDRAELRTADGALAVSLARDEVQ